MLKQLIQAGSIKEDLVKQQIADLEQELAKISKSKGGRQGKRQVITGYAVGEKP